MSLVMNDLQHVCDSTCVVILHHLQRQKVRASYNYLVAYCHDLAKVLSSQCQDVTNC